jgi:hypothetical protein
MPKPQNTTQTGINRERKSAIRNAYAATSKASLDYWKRRVFIPHYVRDGAKIASGNYAVEIQHGGRRRRLSLLTPNRAAAAERARQLFLLVQSSGWQAALAEFRPPAEAPVSKDRLTVGEYLALLRTHSDVRVSALADYSGALRTIVASAFGYKADGAKHSRTHYSEWLARVEGVRLAELTPSVIRSWKRDFLARVADNPVLLRRARTSVNSCLRGAKALFGAKITRHLPIKVDNPFSEIEPEPRQSMRYHSQVDVRELITRARTELTDTDPEAYKAFLLATFAGLRRSEIDALQWAQVHYGQGVIHVGVTEHFQPKNEASIGNVAVDGEVLEVLRDYHARAQGPFVIESDAPRSLLLSRRRGGRYRCREVFERLAAWLRSNGMSGELRPVHALRKEFGSAINESFGIYAASRALRHANLAITESIYIDSRGSRPTTGLGRFLSAAGGEDRSYRWSRGNPGREAGF